MPNVTHANRPDHEVRSELNTALPSPARLGTGGREPVRMRVPGGNGIYHVIPRCHDLKFMLSDDKAKEAFVELMRRVEGFTGCCVLTYVVMCSHVHIVLAENGDPDFTGKEHDEEMLWRIWQLYGGRKTQEVATQWEEWRELGLDSAVEEEKGTYRRRMHNISEFMKALKERYTRWHGRVYKHSGTMWNGRFFSGVAEGDANALLHLACYVDLNPVRAEMVEDPAAFEWSGYGAACHGDVRAKAGLEELFRRSFTLSQGTSEGEDGWEWIGERYRAAMYIAGVERTDLAGNLIKPGFSAEEIEAVVAGEEDLTFSQKLRRRARYFVRAVLFGSREFVAKHHDQAMGCLRLKNAREPKETECGVFAFRRLRSEGPKAPG